jgi:hypothetical protein
MAEELLEAQAVEEPVADEDAQVEERVRPLPERSRRPEIEALRGEMRTAAIAAAGGVVASAATVAAVRAVRSTGSRRGRRKLVPRRSDRDRPQGIIASRSFLVDVHLLGR